MGCTPDDYTPFGVFCWNFGVLYYPREPQGRALAELEYRHHGPVVLEVTLAPEKQEI
ncbi:MAG: hypothetical protein ACFCUT_21750 [Kiloniellaceae bacterium]